MQHGIETRERVKEHLVASRGNVRRTARETGISKNTVRRWRDQFDIAPLPTSDKATPWELALRSSEIFWSRVDKDAPGGCWLWQGRRNRSGYGKFGESGGLAHRFAYEEAHGPIKGHLHHVCKNRLCVNPAHLLPVADAVAHLRLERLEREFIAFVSSLKPDTFVE